MPIAWYNASTASRIVSVVVARLTLVLHCVPITFAILLNNSQVRYWRLPYCCAMIRAMERSKSSVSLCSCNQLSIMRGK